MIVIGDKQLAPNASLIARRMFSCAPEAEVGPQLKSGRSASRPLVPFNWLVHVL